MKNTISEFDVYIDKAPEFARPIMEKIRTAAHKARPDIREVMKWSRPHFELDGLVAGMSAHKNHVNFGFWKGDLLDDRDGLLERVGNTAMTGMKLERVSDLPTHKVLVGFFKRAVQLNLEGVKPVQKKKMAGTRPAPKAPADLMTALKKNKRALKTFEAFSPSNKREYVDWITGARREATREKRLAQAVEWMADGKPRNWKYMSC